MQEAALLQELQQCRALGDVMDVGHGLSQCLLEILALLEADVVDSSPIIVRG